MPNSNERANIKRWQKHRDGRSSRQKHETVDRVTEQSYPSVDRVSVSTCGTGSIDANLANFLANQKKMAEQAKTAKLTKLTELKNSAKQRKATERERLRAFRDAQISPIAAKRKRKNAENMTSVRAGETILTAKRRRIADLTQTAATRAVEDTPTIARRKVKNRRRTAATRAVEDTPTIARRKVKNRRRTAATRAVEDTPTIARRKVKNRRRTAATRAVDDTPTIARRKVKNRRRTAATRAVEDTPTVARRKVINRRRTAATRAVEDTPTVARRKVKNRRRTAATRAVEDTPTVARRKVKNRSRTAATRAVEDTPTVARRKVKNRRRTAATRAVEDTPTVARRKVKNRSRTATTREQEGPSASKKRKLAAKDREATRRKSEEDAARLARLAKAKKRRTSSRVTDLLHQSSNLNVDNEQDFIPLASDLDVEDPAVQFHVVMRSLQFQSCSVCDESFPDMMLNKDGTTCKRCTNQEHEMGITSGNTRKFHESNNMNPGSVPPELTNLSPVEEMLIARVMPMMTVYRLPLGQYGYKANVINIPQDVEEVANRLPRLGSEIDVVVVRKQGQAGTFKDFTVRRIVVQKALEWLKENRYYTSIVIDQDRLDTLPLKGQLDLNNVVDDQQMDKVTTEANVVPSRSDSFCKNCDQQMDIISTEADVVPARSNSFCKDCDNSLAEEILNDELNTELDPNFIVSTFLPVAVSCGAEKENISERVNLLTGDPETLSLLSWPKQNQKQPIDEFRDVGYLSKAFPTLLPTGAADLNGPRNMSITPLEYFRHLMRYKDGRFARHSRFRYFAANSYLRWRVLSTGSFYIKQHTEDAHLHIEDLQELSKKDREGLVKKIVRFGSNLPATPAFWRKNRSELIAFIEQKGVIPTVFFTLSAADLQWPDLHSLIPGYSTKSTAVNENPLICDWFFTKRVEVLIETVLKPKLKIEDYWGRFEFQHRGSVHFHGLAWLSGAPDTSQLREDDAGSIEECLQYFDRLVTAVNPGFDEDGNDNTPRFSANPANTSYFKISDPALDYLGLIMYCQRHTKCMESYCLRKIKGEFKCRFNFPKPLEKESRVEFIADEKTGETYCEFIPKRNDPRLNTHNRELLQIHRANIDVQPIVHKKKVVSYLTKYVTKPEVRSEGLSFLANASLIRLNPSGPVKKIAQKVLIKSIGDRDYSAQETMHILMDSKLTLHSRPFVHLSLNGERELRLNDDDDAGEKVTVSNDVDKYSSRPVEYNGLSLFDFMRSHFFKGKRVGDRRSKAVVIPHPYISPDPNGPRYEEFCRQYLMLQKTFRTMQDLRRGFKTFVEACTDFQSKNLAFGDRFLLEEAVRVNVADAETETGQETGADHCCNDLANVGDTLSVEDDWMYLCRVNPEFNARMQESSDFDWQQSYRNTARYAHAAEFIDELSNLECEAPTYQPVNVDSMTPEQILAYRDVEAHFHITDVSTLDPLLKVVTGTAGTGKSFLINGIRSLLKDACMLLAPTGVAACNISGQTIHSALGLPVGQEFIALRGERLRDLQEKWKNIRYIIIDEMSMVGKRMMGMIDSRLRQVFLRQCNTVFGGCSVIIFGDFGQLPPVCDSAMFSSGRGSLLQDRGHMCYLQFWSSTVLKTIVRQREDDTFKSLLLRLRDGASTEQDYVLLSSRCLGNVEINDALLNNAVHIYATVKDSEEYYFDALIKMNQPIAMIEAEHTGGRTAQRATFDDAGGLQRFLRLCKGATIFLTANLSVASGLCNGTRGQIIDIVYKESRPPSLPYMVACQFAKYNGPPFIANVPGSYPIFSIRREFTINGISCSRRTLPLRLGFALTMHRSQGLTLDTAVVDIGSKDFSTGLSFVALSRVRNMKDLYLRRFDYSRLKSLGKSKRLLERLTEDERLLSMSTDGQDGRIVEQETGADYFCNNLANVRKQSTLSDANPHSSPLEQIDHCSPDRILNVTLSLRLQNRRFECYSNSLVQAMLPLQHFFGSLTDSRHRCASELLAFHQLDMQQSQRIHSTASFRSAISPTFSDDTQQQDPTEMFLMMIEKLDARAAEPFRLYISTKFVCSNCQQHSYLGGIDTTVVSLNLPDDACECSLSKLVDSTKRSEVSKDCSDCGSKMVRHMKHITYHLPDELQYLVILLQKFTQNNIRVNGRIEDFNLDKVHLLGQNFELLSSIVHEGPNPNSGHYTTLRRCGGRFILCDDDKENRLLGKDEAPAVVKENSNMLILSKI